MDQQSIDLYIGGHENNIDARALTDGSAAFVRLLENAADASRAAGNRGPKPRWVIEHLKTGSIDIGIAPDEATAETGEQVIETVTAGIRVLDTEPRMPIGWTRSMLLQLQKIGRLGEHAGVSGVQISSETLGKVALERAVLRNVQTILNQSVASIGAVTGKLVGWHVANDTDHVEVRDESTGNAIDVVIRDSSIADIGLLLRKRVRVQGILNRNLEGVKESIEAKRIEEVEPRSRVSIRDIAGSLGTDWTDGINPVTWQRRHRDIG
ncbi:hypothetical protein E7Z53_07855 [Kocuria salina]|uniref:hypothetical protein n=1 Tax=Kocuria salina TaxID=1929416 RepID=UPI001593228D|nr:hypothetical protein [Kocuria salina]NVC23356.1 hypothetical protein [Kocuria salina]